jgi:co-chaperonin GroES (HSP10)
MKMMKGKPTGYHVEVEVETVEEMSAGGIVLNTGKDLKREQDGHHKGKIIAFGPTAYKSLQGCDSPVEWGVEVGDRVMFTRYDGKLVEEDSDDKRRLVRDTDIIYVLGEDNE